MKWVKIAPVVKIKNLIMQVEKCDPKQKFDFINYVDISGLDNLTKTIAEVQNLISINAPSRARQLIYRHDILVSTVRPNLNAVALVEKAYENLIASTGFCVLRANINLLDHVWNSQRQILFRMILMKASCMKAAWDSGSFS